MGRRPKGYIDDLGKLLSKAVKTGDDKLANELRQRIAREADQQLTKFKGKEQLIKEWNSKIAAYDYTKKEWEKATGARKKMLASKLRGMEERMPNVGKRQQANMDDSLMSAGERRLRREQLRQQGGKNAPQNVVSRQKKQMSAREVAQQALKNAKKGKGRGKTR
jgi:hypothetical protein